MLEKYAEAELRFLELDLMLGDPAVVTDDDNYQKLLSEWRRLRPMFDIYQQYQAIQIELEDVQVLAESADNGIRELAHEEITQLSIKLSDLEMQMLFRLRPDPRDKMSVVIEFNTSSQDRQYTIRYNFLRMIIRYLVSQNLDIRFYEAGHCHDSLRTELIYIEENEIYRKLKTEHGVHQFIYHDESGNQQEYNIYVEVIPHAPDKALDIDMDDIEIKILRCMAPGGMSLIRYEMARLIHKPTGLSASVTGRGGYIQSVYVGRQILASKVYNYQLDQQMFADRQQVIRRYDSINNTVVDYRLPEVVFDLKEMQANGLGQIIDQVIRQQYNL